MSEHLSLEEAKRKWHGTFRGYAIGFTASLLLTLLSFSLALFKPFSPMVLVGVLVGLGLVQAIVQLIFFLHLRKGDKPHWERAVFYSMLFILLVLALGSMWIMSDLNKRLMSM